MKQVLFFTLFSFIFLHSCQEQQAHSNESGSITLNNGQRWEANPETTAGIETMQTVLANAKQGTHNMVHLYDELDNAFQDIFRQCTMTGEAHDRLHDYLLPLKGLLEKVQTARPEEEAGVMNEIGIYLDAYQNYFTTSGSSFEK